MIGFNAAGTTPSPPDVLAGLTTAVFVSGVGHDFDPNSDIYPQREARSLYYHHAF